MTTSQENLILKVNRQGHWLFLKMRGLLEAGWWKSTISIMDEKHVEGLKRPCRPDTEPARFQAVEVPKGINQKIKMMQGSVVCFPSVQNWVLALPKLFPGNAEFLTSFCRCWPINWCTFHKNPRNTSCSSSEVCDSSRKAAVREIADWHIMRHWGFSRNSLLLWTFLTPFLTQKTTSKANAQLFILLMICTEPK